MDNFSLSKLRDLLPSLPQLSPSAEEMDHETQASTADDHDTATPAPKSSPAPPKSSTTPPKSSKTPPPPSTSTAHPPPYPPPSSETHPALLDPLPIDETRPKSNLDLINECDSFPYFSHNPSLYLAHTSLYYHLRCLPHVDTTLGYILPSVAEVLRGIPGWTLDDDQRTLTLTSGRSEEERTALVAATTAAMRETGHFTILKGWRNELYPVYGPAPQKELLFSIERAASALFGIVTYGIHMTAYTYTASAAADADADADAADGGRGKRELKLWTPRRSPTKQTYGGMLDNTVAGGMATGETPFECLVREAHEEASLPQHMVRESAKPAGTVTYFHIRDSRAGGETRLLQPECQYIFDLELPEGVKPEPCDDEVDQFYLLGVDELKEKLRNGDFKPNCAVVLLDFFVRHGILNAEDDSDYIDIVARLHRRLDFPTL